VIVRRLTICVLAAFAGAGCIVNAAPPDEGASAAPTAQAGAETVPVSPTSPQQATTNTTTTMPMGQGFQVMDQSHDPSHDPPPPRPWEPGPNAAALGTSLDEANQKPKIGGAKEDDGSKPTK